MKIGVFVPLIASERGHENNASGHIQIPAHSMRLLRNAGHEVHLISNKFGSEYTLPECVPGGIRMHFVDDGRRRPKLLRGEFPKRGVHVTRLCKQIHQIKKIVRNESLEVLHLFGFLATAQLGGLLSRLGLGSPTIATIVCGSLPPRLNMATRFLLNGLSEIIGSTEFTTRQYTRLGFEARTIRHGIVRDLMAELNGCETGPRRRVLFWRDPSFDNGADIGLKAFDKLAPEFPHLTFDFAIRPWFDEVVGIEEIANRHNNVNVFRFPYENGISLPQLVAESLIVVMPFRQLTLDPQYAIAESLAAGVPVIASNLNSCPEIIEDGETGAIVPIGEVPPVISALREFLQDESRLQHMASHTAQRFSARWNWNNYVKELSEVYSRVVA